MRKRRLFDLYVCIRSVQKFLFCGMLWINMTGVAQNDSVAFQLILIGDAGSIPTQSAGQILPPQIRQSAVPSVVVFLGDNIYPRGLPGPGDKDRKESEQILLNQVSVASGVGDIYFVPGNHDWKRGKHEGHRYLLNQQAFLDSLKNHQVHFPLREGCPGPEEMHLSNDLVLVILDTQWFLHPWDKPEGEKSHCEAKSAADVTIQLDDILNRNQGKRVVLAGHHPVFTYGPHGGVSTFNDHLFPFTAINKNLFVPVPVVGSLVPLYRKFFGGIQDVAHPLNKAMRKGLLGVMGQYPGTVYVSGHEHALQYIEFDSVYFVGSGSGSKSSPVKLKGFSRFASSEMGFARMLIKKDGGAEVEYYSWREKLFSVSLPKIKKVERENRLIDDYGSLLVTSNASDQYQASNFRKKLLGENYRAEWNQKIPVKPLDIGIEKGGLKIIKRGGGMETMALRLKDSIGREYMLRSVEKYPVNALPANFRKTFLQSVVQDQVSAEHPYGALVVAPLAVAAGVYHTNPRFVFAPDDPRWGIYRKDFSGQLMLFEERPDGNGKDMPFFGNPERMISTHRLLEHMVHDNSVQIDQKFVLRSRLFDMWIGDWDRHDDQWRWGEFDQKRARIYRPIPRDRDQAFFVNEGFAPHMWRKPYIFPYLEGFASTIRWAPGFMQQGRWFDRTFLNTLSEEEFIREAQDLSARVTDAKIDSAVSRLPLEIYQLHGPLIAEKLKARRSILVNNSKIYYQFLAKQVDVVGSNKREWFEALWQPNGNLNVKMFKRDTHGHRGKLLYEREFIKNQTKELRLYGLGGDDLFHFSGSGPGAMKVRIVGGEGQDLVTNESKGPSPIFLYDKKGGVNVEGGSLHDRTSSDPQVNDYNRKSFEYNKVAPKNSLAYSIDDGIHIGTGVEITTHGFGKKPYQSHHLLRGSFAIRTYSFNILYGGRFPRVAGKWDLELDADVKSPNYVNNFFGWGNESVFDQSINQQPGISVSSPIDYYRYRIREIKGEVKLSHKIGQRGYFKAGPVFQRGQIINPPEDRYIKEYDSTLQESILDEPKNFGGVTYSWGFDGRDHVGHPTRGIVFKQTSRWMAGFDAPNFSSHSASLTLHQSLRLPALVTYVFNAGAGHNTGAYQLYQAQTLDGETEIRGFRSTRFYGDTKVHFNNEVRIKVGSLRTYLFPASIGIHAFYDVGRVWYKDANGIDPTVSSGTSNLWHRSYGGGLWFTPFDLTTIVTEVGHSIEGTLFYLRLGFLF